MVLVAYSKEYTKTATPVGGSSQLSKKRFMLGITSGFKPSDVYSKSQTLPKERAVLL